MMPVPGQPTTAPPPLANPAQLPNVDETATPQEEQPVPRAAAAALTGSPSTGQQLVPSAAEAATLRE